MPKTLTPDQLQSRKDKAVRFVRDVLGDPDRAEEIEGESLEDYATRRKITLANSGREAVMTKQQLIDRVQELEEENETLSDQLQAVADIVTGEDEEEDTDDTDDDDDDAGE